MKSVICYAVQNSYTPQQNILESFSFVQKWPCAIAAQRDLSFSEGIKDNNRDKLESLAEM